MPPWLWVWLIGDLAVLIPGQISDERYQFAEYTGHGDIPGRLTAGRTCLQEGFCGVSAV